MAASLQPGLEHAFDVVVEGDLLTTVGGTLPRPVLATPRMIGLMEHAATRAVSPHLPEGCTSVGFEVAVRHVAPAPEGSSCRVRARLRDVRDGRKLRFDVEVSSDGAVIGTGTHERRVISRDGRAGRGGTR